MLVRLIYASRACEPISHELVDGILATARRHNPVNGVTGVLCHSEDVFVQALEGGRDQVNQLYARLLQDKRHKDVVLLCYEEIDVRRYSSWTMGKVRLDKVNRSLLLKYSCSGVLNPYDVSGCATVALLEELAETGAFAVRD
ncbi:BLUF domain-containing protein [Herbaspirillum sp. RV1423]|uniref:BLUF domain-containing protein n=1 Tax=Herbaspirillum sp. RV1423 TaxID=1443993 RepID=UPI0004B35154|nr:BLUF domain-containing protein [Herbaspirillum sp. RV1423]